MCLLREELDAEVTDWGDKWTRWQTVSVAPKGRRGNSAPLIMRSKEITSAAAIRNFFYVSPLRCCTPRLTERCTGQFQSKYEHTSVQSQNILPLFLLHGTYLTPLLFCLNFNLGNVQCMMLFEFRLKEEQPGSEELNIYCIGHVTYIEKLSLG